MPEAPRAIAKAPLGGLTLGQASAQTKDLQRRDLTRVNPLAGHGLPVIEKFYNDQRYLSLAHGA